MGIIDDCKSDDAKALLDEDFFGEPVTVVGADGTEAATTALIERNALKPSEENPDLFSANVEIHILRSQLPAGLIGGKILFSPVCGETAMEFVIRASSIIDSDNVWVAMRF